LLCAAGLKRLDIDEGTAIPTETLLPAPGQAVIAMECRTNDTRTQSVLTTVNNQITFDCVRAERAFTRALGASCHSPVAAFCAFEDGDLRLRGQLFSEDGRDLVEERVVFDCGEDGPPQELARSLLAKAPESVRRHFGG
jgi:hydroxymethylbilane synthase